METIQGKTPVELNRTELQKRLTSYKHIHLDLGTGDGRFINYMAEQHPRSFFIGVDACRENLRATSGKRLPNALFVIASAQSLPKELNGLISHITINFPWGSLLENLLTGDTRLMNSLEYISSSIASVEVRLNGGALTEAGTALEAGADQIYNNMLRFGWELNKPLLMNANALRNFPSTWAKRLAFGRDPRAMAISGYFK
ncbi:MAG TPA: class I SAM-dependent methyltransferase [Anaerolineales bacterium]|nr:class I SAM-dependent methyltransferase [Anaerolineales bacterium]